MAYRVKIKSEADVLNDIERRIRARKVVSDREKMLLAEAYKVYKVPFKDRVKIK